MDNIKIKDIGSFLELDGKGFLVNPTSLSKIISPWKEAIEDIKSEYIENLGIENIHSIWLRGSVAKGAAIENVSDIDTFCLTNKPVEELNIAWIKDSEKQILKKFKFPSSIEFGFKEYKKLEKASWKTFTIKTEGICIHGEDISKEVEPYAPNKELANILNENLPRVIEQTKNYFKTTKRPEFICTWIMKRFLRQGLILTLAKEKKYSRDLYKCYEIFSKVYPEKEKEMMKTLDLAINPTSNKEEMISILDSFGNWIIKESKKVLS